MRKRLLAVVTTAALAAGTALVVPVAGAQEPSSNRLDLTIDPTQGPPGTVIDSFVPPDQAMDVCLDPDVALDELIAQLEDLELEAILEGLPGVGAVLGGVIGALPGIGGVALFYVLAFADIATQDPIGPTSDWSPLTGEGQIVAPEAAPGFYAVAALCLGLNTDVDLDEVVAALEGVDLNNPDAVAEAVLMPFVDTEDPIGIGFQLYCLGDPAFCEVPLRDIDLPVDGPPGDGPAGPAAPVTGAPRFTG